MSWIRAIVLSLAVTLPASASARAGELTTHDLVELHRAGLGDEVLIALIEVDGGTFTLSQADLLDLKALGLSERVIAALVRAGRHDLQTAVEPEPMPVSDEWTYVERHHTEVVAVPVPVYVPVHPPRRPRPHPPSGGTAEPATTSRQGRATVPLGTAPDRVRPAATTVDDIRHAPPGFHPGTASATQGRATSPPRANPAGREPTPGVVRSSDRSSSATTPGVARSRRQ